MLSILLIGALVTAIFWNADYYGRVIAIIVLAGIAASGLNLVTGVTGQISLGHAGFYAVGAYVTALLSVRLGWPVIATLPVSIALNALLGVALAWPALRLKGPYLTMVTVAFGMIIYRGALEFTGITNGPEGVFPVPAVNLGGWNLTVHGFNIFLICVLAVVVWIQAALISSRYGRAMRALRGNQLAAASLGVPVVAMKCLAFCLSGAIAGLAGSLFAPLNGYVNPDGFSLDLSVQLLVMVILGGSGTIYGPLIGAALLTGMDQLLSGLGDIRLVIYGGVLILVLYAIPEGFVGKLKKVFGHTKVDETGDSVASPVHMSAASPAHRLTVRGLGKKFGGLAAVADVSFSVAPASVHAVVGPNGAGKTTLLNLISGITRPSSGEIAYGEVDLAACEIHRMTNAGIARTFQNLALFPEMTVLENVLVGMHTRLTSSLLSSIAQSPGFRREECKSRARALELLRFVGLDRLANEMATELPQGHQRLLEIARALAANPSLLLLDEPAAGLNATEISRLMKLIRDVRDSGVTVVLIEHHMRLVMNICDTITVLDFGKKIAEGVPEHVRHNAAVIEAYLGKPREKKNANSQKTA